MLKTIVCLILLIISTFGAYSQHILKGKVYNPATQQPIEKATVFLDGTSIYTTTDSEGKFEFNLQRRINTQLIISHLAYDIIAVNEPFDGIPEVVYLHEKLTALKPVEAVAPFFTREQKLQMFKNEFLGRTASGRACEILNEDDIELFYDMEQKRLTAFCEVPIIIHNNYLGYEVRFNLLEFFAEYEYDSLFRETPTGPQRISLEYAQHSFSGGTSSFIDINPKNRTVKKNRLSTYKQSTAFFVRNLVDNTLSKAGYRLYTNGFQVKPERIFEITDTLAIKKVTLLPGSGIDTTFEIDSIQIVGRLIIEDTKPVSQASSWFSSFTPQNSQSQMLLMTNSFLVDEMGYIDQVEKVWFSGKLGIPRIADLLPLDYYITVK